MRSSRLFLFFIYVFSTKLFCQVGINTTNPNATLDITATNMTTPTSEDGILIPRVNEFPASNPTALQDGMLLFATGNGTPAKGFYYWDNTGTSWMPVTTAEDADWYVESTTTIPTSTNDDIYHLGNIALGKNVADYLLDAASMGTRVGNFVQTGSLTADSDVLFLESTVASTQEKLGLRIDLNTTGSGSQSGIYNTLTTNTGSGAHNGIYQRITGAGGTGITGMYNALANSGNAVQYGIYNFNNGNGTGDHYGVVNNMVARGSGDIIGTENRVFNDGNGDFYGTRNELSGPGTGNRFATYNFMDGTSNALLYGNYSLIENSGDGNHFGVRNELTGTGTGDHYGSYNSLSGTGTGLMYGSYNEVSVTSTNLLYGTYNLLTGNGNGIQVGSRNNLSGTGTGGKAGVQSIITGNGSGGKVGVSNLIEGGSGNHLGLNTVLAGTEGGTRKGVFTQITNTGGGLLYGVHNQLNASILNTTNKYGLYNEIMNASEGTGVYNAISNTGLLQGVYNELSGGENMYGMNSTLTHVGDGTVYGVKSSISVNNTNDYVYGNYTEITGSINAGSPSASRVYGDYISLNVSSSIHDQYGQYINLNPFISSGNVYGLYVEMDGGANNYYGIYSDANNAGYSGYFTGGEMYIGHTARVTGALYVGNSVTDSHQFLSGNLYMDYSNNGNGSIVFSNVSDNLITMFTSGASNPQKMILSHSSTYPNWGLAYADVDDAFIFEAGGTDKVEIDLTGSPILTVHGVTQSEEISVGIAVPTHDVTIKQSGSTEGSAGGLGLISPFSTDHWKVYHSGSHLSFAENGVRRAYVQAGTGNYMVTSDRRLKKNIETLTPVLDKIALLQAYSYHYKSQETSQNKVIGFMAQEVQEIFPEAVTENEEGFLSINYDLFGVLAIKSLQEQQEEIDLLKKQLQQIDSLQERIIAIEQLLVKK